jgi:saccharopine dehydrogenase (NAD+, L-lysine-forming)
LTNAMIGIRKEDINRWERRVPLIPEHVRELKERYSVETWVEPSGIRIFPEQAYAKAGAKIEGDLTPCSAIFGIKEMPLEVFKEGKTYVFFAHVIKGQGHNMPMLKRIMEVKSNLIDYEKIEDKRGTRLIFFGRYAGLAGMIDTLWALGKRLQWEGIRSPFVRIRPAHRYGSLAEAEAEIEEVGKQIKIKGLPDSMTPFVCGLAGYGHVSRGAQEIIDLLPVKEITPEELLRSSEGTGYLRDRVYKVVFKEEHMVEPVSPRDTFELQDYYDHPEKYRSRFSGYIPHLTILMNCIYWEQRYPRLVTKSYLRELFTSQQTPRLRLIGDISCDVKGAIECTLKATDPGNPIYVYDPLEESITDGHQGRGPVILAVYNLPCELPKDSSTYFGGVLRKFVPEIARADYSVSFERLKLPDSVKNAVIVHRGELTPKYRYIERYL